MAKKKTPTVIEAKDPPSSVCKCGHSDQWHQPNACQFPGCGCRGFALARVLRDERRG